MAAQNKPIDTKCSSAISFMKVVGIKITAIPMAYDPLQVPKCCSQLFQKSDFITFKAILLKTFTNIIIKKKLLTQTQKQIMNIEALPRQRYPISKSDDGRFGQTSLALR